MYFFIKVFDIWRIELVCFDLNFARDGCRDPLNGRQVLLIEI